MTEPSDIPFGLEVTKGTVAKLLMAVVGFAGSILFARILGPDRFGGYYLIWSAVVIAKLPVDGFAGASKKRFSEHVSDRSSILGATLLVIAVTSIVATVVVTLAQKQIAAYTNLENAYLMFIVLFVTVTLFAPLQRMLTATGRVSLSIWVDLIRSIFTTPLQLGFILLGAGAAGMAYGLSLATALTLPLTGYLLGTIPKIPSRKILYDLWTFARFSVLSTTLGRIYSRFDILLLGLLLTPTAAGEYEVALQLTLPAVLLSEVAGDGLMARVSNLQSKGQEFASDINNTLSFTSILAFPMFFGSLVLSRPLVITIYGGQFATAAPLLIGLALFRVVRTQTGPLIQTIDGIDHPEINVGISSVTLLLNIALGVVLTLEFGSIGVVAATVIAESVRYVMLFVIMKRHVPESELLPHTLFEQLTASMLMAGIVFGLRQFVAIRSWIPLLSLIVVGASVYAIVLITISESLRYTVSTILSEQVRR